MAKILVVDDNQPLCQSLCASLQSMGHEPSAVTSLLEGIERASAHAYDAVFLDVQMPDGNGLNLIPAFREMPSSPEVIIITGEGDPDGAELAMKSGAWDYVEKPFRLKTLEMQISRVLQYRREKAQKKPRVTTFHPEGIIGQSPQVRRCLDLLGQAAGSDVNVLITGETGTGKELFAKALHRNSSRKRNPFIVVDCAALPKTLVESILFGHKKGAFTGAEKDKEGLVKQADGGTLFLDEVGDLPLSLQKKFLRVLQERAFRPVGGKEERFSDFRLVAATNRDLQQMVMEGTFREDLLYRLRSTVIFLPPLRERKNDVKEIAMHYIHSLCERLGVDVKGFAPEYMQDICDYWWPGNVRQLVNAIEASIANAGAEPTLYSIHLPDDIRVDLARRSFAPKIAGQPDFEISELSLEQCPDLRNWINDKEKKYLEDIIALTGGNMKEACRLSGLASSSFYYRLQKHNIRRPA